jgi:hypothetical protein
MNGAGDTPLSLSFPPITQKEVEEAIAMRKSLEDASIRKPLKKHFQICNS